MNQGILGCLSPEVLDDLTEDKKLRDVLYFARRKYFGLLVACVVFQLGLSLFILIDDISNQSIGF